MEVREILEEYKKDGEKEFHRFNSWKHCYEFFQYEYFNDKTNDEDKDNLAALNLGFYLASWGMYRGSSFLLQNDYKIHIDIVTYLKENFREKDYKYSFNEILELITEIRELYKKAHCNSSKSNNVSNILVSKILLGTYGCLPAYDRFFIKGMYTGDNKLTGLSKRSFDYLNEFYENNIEVFNEYKERYKYPEMKLLDMYFWRVGYEKSKKEIAERKAQKEISLK